MQSITIAGANLTTSLTLKAPVGFEISLKNNDDWTTNLTLNPKTGGSILSTIVYVSYNPKALGSQYGDLNFLSGTTNLKTILLKGSANQMTHVECTSIPVWNTTSIYEKSEQVVYDNKLYVSNWWNQANAPDPVEQYGPWTVQSECVFTTLTVLPTTKKVFSTLLGTPTASQTIQVTATDVFDVVTVEVSNNYEIVLNSNGIYTNSIMLTPLNNTISQTIFVRYNPSSAGTHKGAVKISSQGIGNTIVELEGVSNALWTQTTPQKVELNTAITQVGIGTSVVPASYMMAVNGKILARGLKIQANGWADFVFDDTYSLAPLSEVENFVQTNKHLPNVPSAAVLTNEGLDTAEMLTIQMQKIEELTLYLIALDKENKLLQQRVQQLENE